MNWYVFEWNLFTLMGISFIFAIILTAFCRWLGHKLGMLDQPRERRVHSKPQPFSGGLAIFASFCFSLLLMGGFSFPYLIPILSGSFLIFLLGLFDDQYDLSAGFKLVIQILICTLTTCSGVRISYLTNPFGNMVTLGWASYPLTICWLLVTINMINLIDGLDGLAAGISAIAGGCLLVIGMGLGQSAAVFLCAILIGVLLGFLPYNFYPARIFMGNSGAYFLGYILGVISVMGALKLPTVLALAIPVFAMGIPFLDTLWAIWRRWRNDQPIMVGDSYHIHHLLLISGRGTRKTVLLLYGMSLISGLASIFLSRVTVLLGTLILLIAFILVFFCLRGLGDMQSAAQEREKEQNRNKKEHGRKIVLY